MNFQQTDSGGTGHVLASAVTGDYNSITTQQQGTNNTTVNMVTTGDHNTITVFPRLQNHGNAQSAGTAGCSCHPGSA